MRKYVEGMLKMVAVFIWILCDANLGRTMFELFDRWRVFVSNSQLVVLSKRPFEIWTSRYSFLRFDKLAISNQVV